MTSCDGGGCPVSVKITVDYGDGSGKVVNPDPSNPGATEQDIFNHVYAIPGTYYINAQGKSHY